MSHAEYAPKRLPVLPRLVMALRRIPAVDFAFTKIGSLLRRRTNAEQTAASEFVAAPSDSVTDTIELVGRESDAIEPNAAEGEPVAADTTDVDTLDAKSPIVDSVESDTVEPDAIETNGFAIEAVEATEAAITLDEVDLRGADDVASSGTTSDDLADKENESVSIEPRAGERVANEPIEIDAMEAVPMNVEAAASDMVEGDTAKPDAVASAVATDDIASTEARRDALEIGSIEADTQIADLAPSDPVEIAASEMPPIALDTAATGTIDIRVDQVASVETAAIDIDEVTPPLAAFEACSEAQPSAEADVASALAAAVDEPLDREALIRRRWRETGIMMWRGSGQSTLCIQGSAALLPPKPGETMPQYDRLEFRLVDGLIVCEGYVVDPPEPLKSRAFARAA